MDNQPEKVTQSQIDEIEILEATGSHLTRSLAALGRRPVGDESVSYIELKDGTRIECKLRRLT